VGSAGGAISSIARRCNARAAVRGRASPWPKPNPRRGIAILVSREASGLRGALVRGPSGDPQIPHRYEWVLRTPCAAPQRTQTLSLGMREGGIGKGSQDKRGQWNQGERLSVGRVGLAGRARDGNGAGLGRGGGG